MNKMFIVMALLVALVFFSACLQQPDTGTTPPVVQQPDTGVNDIPAADDAEADDVPAGSGTGVDDGSGSVSDSESLKGPGLACSFDADGIEYERSLRGGVMVQMFWNIPVKVANNSGNDAKNVVLELTPEGMDMDPLDYKLGDISAGETYEGTVKYSVARRKWLDPATEVISDNVEAGSSCSTIIKYTSE